VAFTSAPSVYGSWPDGACDAGSSTPQLRLSASSVNIPPTTVNTTSAPSTVTLTNTGNGSLSLTSIVLGGSNATSFAMSTTCGLTLAAGSSCNVVLTFTPTAVSSYTATVTITDNAGGSPHTISVTGSATAPGTTHTLLTFPETDHSVTPLYGLVNNAQHTLDMTMYALQDTTFVADLVAACSRGVIVRAVLDGNNEKSNNTPAFTALNAQANCSAVWSNKAFLSTHQKSILIDGTLVAVMSLNLQSQYYSTTRDYAMITNDPADIAAIEATFNADYAAGTTSTGTVGASDFSYQPGAGSDLIWSPTTAQTAMLALINNAQSTLIIENEEMGASNIVSALQAACVRGVTVRIAMVSQSSYGANFKALESSGCGVHVYPNTTNGFYIHAKAVVADYGLATQTVYMGSINYSSASMNSNRELGLYITDAASVQSLYSTMAADYAGGTTY